MKLRRRSTSSSKQEEALSNLMKRKRETTFNQEPPSKIKKIETTIQYPVNFNQVDVLPHYQEEKEKILSIRNHNLGKYDFPISKTVPGRAQYLVRELNPTYVTNLKNEIINNSCGSLFRPCFVINIYDKDKKEISNYSQDTYEDLFAEMKRTPSAALFDSLLFSEYFIFEVLDGNHSAAAIKQLIQDKTIDQFIKEALRLPEAINQCIFYYNLGIFCYLFLYK